MNKQEKKSLFGSGWLGVARGKIGQKYEIITNNRSATKLAPNSKCRQGLMSCSVQEGEGLFCIWKHLAWDPLWNDHQSAWRAEVRFVGKCLQRAAARWMLPVRCSAGKTQKGRTTWSVFWATLAPSLGFSNIVPVHWLANRLLWSDLKVRMIRSFFLFFFFFFFFFKEDRVKE